MTDKTRQDSGSTHIIRYALELGLLWVDGDGRNKVREALDALAALEAQLEAIGAGGVSGPLVGRAAPPTAQAEGWRPIAEHDGSACDVQLYCEGSREQFIGFPGPLVGAFQYCAFPGGTMSCRPSHWRPLPPPPTSAEGVE